MAAALSGAVTAVVLVIMGFGIGALVAQQIVQSAVSTVVVLAAAPFRPRLRFSLAEFRSLFSYGAYVLMLQVVQFLNGNIDRPLIAGALSPQVLGYFTMSKQVVAAPIKIISQMSRKVLFPILSSIQSDKARVGKAYLDVQFAIVTLLAPTTLGISALAEPIVAVLLGEGWAPVAPLIQLVALQSLFFPVAQTNATVLASLGYARLQFWWNLLVSTLSLTALWLAVPYGIEAAILARLSVTALAIPSMSTYTVRQIGLPLSALVRTVAGPIGAAVLMWLAVTQAESAMGLRPAASLAVGVPLGVVVYVAVLMIFARGRVMALLAMIRQRG